MRQAGVIAAAGLVALNKMVDRLVEDHQRATALAAELAKIQWLLLETSSPPTNMIFFRLTDTAPITETELVESLSAQRIRIGNSRGGRFRIVTHYWVNDAAVESIVTAFQSVVT